MHLISNKVTYVNQNIFDFFYCFYAYAMAIDNRLDIVFIFDANSILYSSFVNQVSYDFGAFYIWISLSVEFIKNVN